MSGEIITREWTEGRINRKQGDNQTVKRSERFDCVCTTVLLSASHPALTDEKVLVKMNIIPVALTLTSSIIIWWDQVRLEEVCDINDVKMVIVRP